MRKAKSRESRTTTPFTLRMRVPMRNSKASPSEPEAISAIRTTNGSPPRPAGGHGRPLSRRAAETGLPRLLAVARQRLLERHVVAHVGPPASRGQVVDDHERRAGDPQFKQADGLTAQGARCNSESGKNGGDLRTAVHRRSGHGRRKAGDGTRTRDPQLGKLMLCQLSYSRVVARRHQGSTTST